MSKAFKCDRCGTLYEYDFQHYHFSYYVGKDRYPSENQILDLCPNCQNSLIEWVEGERKEINE